MNTNQRGAAVRYNHSKEVAGWDEAKPTAAPLGDAEFWRQRGCDLVARYGSRQEKAEMKARCIELGRFERRGPVFPPQVRNKALVMAAHGHGRKLIAKSLGVPVGVVRGWICGDAENKKRICDLRWWAKNRVQLNAKRRAQRALVAEQAAA